jgi:hypothetical protein
MFRLLVCRPKLRESDTTPDPRTWCLGFVEAMMSPRRPEAGPLPDFYIGAHAETEKLALLTRDVRTRLYGTAWDICRPWVEDCWKKRCRRK